MDDGWCALLPGGPPLQLFFAPFRPFFGTVLRTRKKPHPSRSVVYNEKLSFVFDAFSLFSLVLYGFMGFLVGFLL